MAERKPPTFQEALVGLLKRIYTHMASKEDMDAIKNELASVASGVEHLSTDLQKIAISLEHLVPELRDAVEKIKAGGPAPGGGEDFPSLASAGLAGEVGGIGGAEIGGLGDLETVLGKLDEILLKIESAGGGGPAIPGDLEGTINEALKRAFDPIISRLQGVVRRGKALETAAVDIAELRSTTRTLTRLVWVLWLLTVLNFLGILGLLLERMGLIQLTLP